jgi:hypothetical protein
MSVALGVPSPGYRLADEIVETPIAEAMRINATTEGRP